MIPIHKEPKSFYEETHLYERCYFCNKPTDTWHHETNKPVCEKCSKIHNISELKTKTLF